jgi:hypothetical protein
LKETIQIDSFIKKYKAKEAKERKEKIRELEEELQKAKLT